MSYIVKIVGSDLDQIREIVCWSNLFIAFHSECLWIKGFTEEQINSIHGPIGIKLGGKSAPEIALSIIAQLVSETYKK